MIIIDPSGDLVIKVVEFDDSMITAPGQDGIVLQEREFLVRKQTIYKNSETIGTMLAWHLSSERAQTTFTIKDDSVTSMEIWFRAMHETLTQASYAAPLKEP